MIGRTLRERRGSLPQWLAILAIGAMVLIVLERFIIDIPDWFAGGESDPAPKGSVIYEGQEAQSASERFLVDIGNGQATVSVKAKQNHDKPGSIFSGDFQSTNGTSSVADPADGSVPATLVVKTDYCSEGMITTTETPPADDAEDDAVTTSIRMDLGELFVCGTTLEHTPENDAAFKQDDTPNEFHGKFVSFVAGAVETVAAAAECPTDELDRFGTEELTSYIARQLAQRFGVPEANVEVVAGTPGTTDAATKRDLRDRLEGYANLEDPDDPDESFEALSVQYLSGTGEAVEDSCYRDPGEKDLKTLEDIDAPRPRR